MSAAHRPPVAWIAAVLALMLPALASGWTDLSHPDALHAALLWERAHTLDQPWRLVTAAWVHGSAVHLAANLATSALVALLGLAARAGARATAAFLLAWPLTHALLAVDPRIQWYAGASGVLHAGVVVAAVGLLRTPRWRVGLCLLAGVAVKIATEQPWALASRYVPILAVDMVPLSHATGACAGLACGAALLLARRRSSGRVNKP